MMAWGESPPPGASAPRQMHVGGEQPDGAGRRLEEQRAVDVDVDRRPLHPARGGLGDHRSAEAHGA